MGKRTWKAILASFAFSKFLLSLILPALFLCFFSNSFFHFSLRFNWCLRVVGTHWHRSRITQAICKLYLVSQIASRFFAMFLYAIVLEPNSVNERQRNKWSGTKVGQTMPATSLFAVLLACSYFSCYYFL